MCMATRSDAESMHLTREFLRHQSSIECTAMRWEDGCIGESSFITETDIVQQGEDKTGSRMSGVVVGSFLRDGCCYGIIIDDDYAR